MFEFLKYSKHKFLLTLIVFAFMPYFHMAMYWPASDSFFFGYVVFLDILNGFLPILLSFIYDVDPLPILGVIFFMFFYPVQFFLMVFVAYSISSTIIYNWSKKRWISIAAVFMIVPLVMGPGILMDQIDQNSGDSSFSSCQAAGGVCVPGVEGSPPDGYVRLYTADCDDKKEEGTRCYIKLQQ